MLLLWHRLVSWCDQLWYLMRCIRRLRRHPLRWRSRPIASLSRRVFAQPKPQWVKREIIRLKAVMPQAGCRTIVHHFNRRWQRTRQMMVSKTYVANMCRRH